MSDSETRENAAQIAERAAALIDQYGWIKGWGGDEEHGFCLYGAATKAHLEMGENRSGRVYEWSAMETAARVISGQEYLSIWNDSSTTKKEDVTGLLRKVARVLRL